MSCTKTKSSYPFQKQNVDSYFLESWTIFWNIPKMNIIITAFAGWNTQYKAVTDHTKIVSLRNLNPHTRPQHTVRQRHLHQLSMSGRCVTLTLFLKVLHFCFDLFLKMIIYINKGIILPVVLYG
jgi:hypothetical protein